jgi:hypothetical protein
MGCGSDKYFIHRDLWTSARASAFRLPTQTTALTSVDSTARFSWPTVERGTWPAPKHSFHARFFSILSASGQNKTHGRYNANVVMMAPCRCPWQRTADGVCGVKQDSFTNCYLHSFVSHKNLELIATKFTYFEPLSVKHVTTHFRRHLFVVRCLIKHWFLKQQRSIRR